MQTQPVDYARPELLVELDWLDQHLRDPDVVIIDCDRPEMRVDRPHIPNARIFPIHPYFNNIETGRGVATREQAETILRGLGVNDNSRVVLYDSEGGLLATRIWWVLWYYGFENAGVLNGGWPAWIASRRPSSLSHPTFEQGNLTLGQPHEDRIAACETILPGLESGEVVPLDVRSDLEWLGAKPAPNPTNEREGRIPGAVHIEWREFIDWNNATRFKPASSILKIFEDHGVTPDKRVVPY